MANRHRGEVEIELDKKRTIRFTMNSLADLESFTGKPFTELLPQNGKETLPISMTRGLLWAGLRHEDPNLAFSDAGDLISESPHGETDLERFTYVMEKVYSAFAEWSGADSKKVKEGFETAQKLVKAQAGTGKKRSSSDSDT